METTAEEVLGYGKENNVRVSNCQIIRSKRIETPRSLCAHLTIDVRDKDTAFVADNWLGEINVRPWKVYNHNMRNYEHRVDL